MTSNKTLNDLIKRSQQLEKEIAELRQELSTKQAEQRGIFGMIIQLSNPLEKDGLHRDINALIRVRDYAHRGLQIGTTE